MKLTDSKMSMSMERAQRIDKIARDILFLSRNTLLVNLRFLDVALSKFVYVPCECSTILTNGRHLLYNPAYVLGSYKQEKELPVRDYLHIVMHCILQHMFVESSLEHTIWDIACDIAVESSITDLHLYSAAAERERRQQAMLNKLKLEVKLLTAEHLYHYFIASGISQAQVDELKDLFCADDHQIWYMTMEDAEKTYSVKLYGSTDEKSEGDGQDCNQHESGRSRTENNSLLEQDNSDDSSGQSGQDRSAGEGNIQTDSDDSGSGDDIQSGQVDGSSEGGSQSGHTDIGCDDNGQPSASSGAGEVSKQSEQDESNGAGGNQSLVDSIMRYIAQEWKKISEHIQQDLNTFSRNYGSQAGNLIQNLREVNRERYDYADFLKRFAVREEAMKIDPDEYDYIFYSYGLHLYQNMPLIEPLEYKEEKHIREFVIAIDTSGSVMGDKVQIFMQKTYNILRSTESFSRKINLHIIQCDAEIKEHVKVTSQKEFDAYLRTMELRGFGGTDFRPVFDFVEQLRTQGEFTNLKGLIYFTDGDGKFPKHKPDYDTAFVFVDDLYNNPDVPPWAIKLTLRKDEL